MCTEPGYVQRYRKTIDAMITRLEDGIKRKQVTGEFFEAVLDKIRLSITGIFNGMLKVSIKQAREPKAAHRDIQAHIDKYRSFPERERVYHMYLFYLEMIGAPWKRALEEARQQEDHETLRKEQVKCEIRDELRNAFIQAYDEEGHNNEKS